MNTLKDSNYDLKAAELFVETIAGQQVPVTFQTFGDRNTEKSHLRQVIHGTIAEHGNRLIDLNNDGAGIFMMVNAGDLKGRSKRNVRSVRAVFIDLDETPLAEIYQSPVAPNIIVETSAGRWHAYWMLSNCPLTHFNSIQKSLADKFKGDPRVTDLPRVMRVPGFYHNKSVPFQVRLHKAIPEPVSSFDDFVAAFDISLKATDRRGTEDNRMSFSRLLSSSVHATQPKAAGRRNESLFSYARRMKAGRPNADVSERRTMVQAWHSHALPNIRTKDIGVSYADFERAWFQIHTPYGAQLERVLNNLQSPPEGIANLCYGLSGSRMIQVMYSLHLHQEKNHRSEPIIMSVRTAAQILGVEKSEAHKILRSLVHNNVLQLVKKGNALRASRWRWVWSGG
jgi:hypothetical protein